MADVRRVLPLALAHRGRRSPFEDHGVDEGAVQEALRAAEEQDGAGGGGEGDGAGDGSEGDGAGDGSAHDGGDQAPVAPLAAGPVVPMGAPRRMEAAKGAAVSLLLDAYQRRDRVALVTFRGEGAEVVLRPTGSVEVARARLASLPTGGRTPLAAGIEAALRVARQGGSPDRPPLLVLLSDGRATAGPPGTDPVEAAVAQAGA